MSTDAGRQAPARWLGPVIIPDLPASPLCCQRVLPRDDPVSISDAIAGCPPWPPEGVGNSARQLRVQATGHASASRWLGDQPLAGGPLVPRGGAGAWSQEWPPPPVCDSARRQFGGATAERAPGDGFRARHAIRGPDVAGANGDRRIHAGAPGARGQPELSRRRSGGSSGPSGRAQRQTRDDPE